MKIPSFGLALVIASATAQKSAADFFSVDADSLLDSFSAWNCFTCGLAVDGVDRVLKTDKFVKLAHSVATKICEFKDFIPQGDDICPTLISSYEHALGYALTRHILNKDRVCNEMLSLCQGPVITQIDLESAVDQILATKPESLKNDDFVDNLYLEIIQTKTKRDTIKAVHLTDTHIDTEYAPGSKVDCGGYLCCRAEYGMAGPGERAAGEWGDNGGKCDLPLKTFQNMMEFIANEIQPDIIFWTGDNSSHNVWSNSMEEVTEYTHIITDTIKDAIKGKQITVIPIQGNHDAWPVDQEDFAEPNENYAINHYKDMWAEWIGEDAATKYGEFGYYSLDIKLENGKGVPEGSKAITINTNVCNSLNFNIWGEREDPGHMFSWLEHELLSVEAAEGLAIMVGHYTPANCQHQFGTRYRALMERFQNVVRFGLAGHIHNESFQVTNSMTNPQKPVMVTSVGGSVTTYGTLNPSFMVLDLDSELMVPTNKHTYYIDMNVTNKNGQPDWTELHDYIEEYSMLDLRPSSFKDLAQRTFLDLDLATKMRYNEHRHTKHYHADQLKMYCELSTSEMHENNECMHSAGMSAYGRDFKLFSGNIMQSVVDRIIGNWIHVSLNESIDQQ